MLCTCCWLYLKCLACLHLQGHAVAQLVDALPYSPEVAASILVGVIEILHWFKSLPAALWPWGSTQPPAEMSTKGIPWGLRRPVRRSVCAKRELYLFPSALISPFSRSTSHIETRQHVSVATNCFCCTGTTMRAVDSHQIWGALRDKVLYLVSIVKPTRCTNVSNLFHFGMTLYIFRTVYPSIINSSRLYIQQPNRYCCLLASKQSAVSVWLLYVQSWTVDDGRIDRPKHIECHPKIK